MTPIALPNRLQSTESSCPSQASSDGDRLSGTSTLDPIAVVGLSFKFPEEAISSGAFWQMMKERRCAMTEWPKDRLNIDAFYHPDSGRRDTIPFRGGHFLKEPIERFDAPFFSITSNEAAAIDPQHRLLLETAYRALENAGIPMAKASGSRTSVYTGCFTDDYRLLTSKDEHDLPTYTATGAAPSMLAARLSWFFNFTGPSVNLDSACSSSLMAVDLACQGLQSGNADMSLVGGASIALALDMSLPLSNMNFLSNDSRSFSFDDRANGYGRGEGFGVVVLKRLSDALRSGDTIRAVIRATGSNQDGRTPGITQPSTESQSRLIRETYENAGLAMEPTRYVEAHGTGTAIGDPVEASAIGRAFRASRKSEEPIYIGAVKSNIGHLEGSSGIAGIIKTLLVLEAGVIPPNANFKTLNPRIDADLLRITFPQTMKPWPSEGLRRASVMSFGFGGSNSHVIMDDACNYLLENGLAGNHWGVQHPPTEQALEDHSMLSHLSTILQEYSQDSSVASEMPRLLVWSATDSEGLRRLEKVYSSHISRVASSLNATSAATYLQGLAYTLAVRRTSFKSKSFVVASSLGAIANDKMSMWKAVRTAATPKLGLVFTGQGAQSPRMAEGLVIYAAFQNSLRRSDMILSELGCQWSLLDELFKDPTITNINSPLYSQPICTAVQIALVDLLHSFAIEPCAVIGHSSGEIAAAYSAGYLSHHSACKVAYLRGICATKLIDSGTKPGAMMAVGLSEELVAPYLQEFTDVVVGCVNSPKSVTLSGNEGSIELIKAALEKDSIFCRKLHVKIAYHSAGMSNVAADYLGLLGDLGLGERPATNPIMISTVTGKKVAQVDVQNPNYWVENLTSQVKFSAALEQICSPGKHSAGKKLKASQNLIQVTDVLEIGPHSALQGPVNDILSTISSNNISYNSVLRRSMPAIESTLDVIGRLYCLGYPVDILQVNQPQNKSDVKALVLPDLPEYPFDHTRAHWSESRLSRGYRFRQNPRMDLLGTAVPDWNPLQARWRMPIRTSEMPWIEDHKVNGTTVYPAAGMLAMVLEGAKQLADDKHKATGYVIKDVTFGSPLTITTQSETTEVQLCLRPSGDLSTKLRSSEFSIFVNNRDQWSETCRGSIHTELASEATEVDGGHEARAKLAGYQGSLQASLSICDKTVENSRMYEYLKHCGLDYGPTFQALQQLSYNDEGFAHAKVAVFPRSAQNTAYHCQEPVIHPTTLDAVFQSIVIALSRGAEREIPTFMPTRIGKLWIAAEGISHPAACAVDVCVNAEFSGRRKAKGGLVAMDEARHEALISLEDMELTTVAAREATAHVQGLKKRLCYNLSWKPDLDLLGHQQLREYCENARPTRSSDAGFYEDLGFLIIMFTKNALEALAQDGLGSPKPHLRQYLTWSRNQLERFHSGSLPNLPNSHPKWASLLENTQYRDSLIQEVQSTNQGRFFLKVAQNLLPMLRGELDPLSFMFQDDGVPDFYKEINRRVICYEPFNRYLELLCHKNPGLKILEIGAGTGATTDFVFNGLSSHEDVDSRNPDCVHYDFTDISPAFFEGAATRFGQMQGRLRFKVLDIESDPSNQGFELGTYDLIIAASVLHATRDLESTMRNARSLLRPGGKLIIFEVTEDVLRARFAFGLLPGWWLSKEEYRQSGPCISLKEWESLLWRTGFSGVDLEIPDYVDDRCHEYTIMMATATEAAHPPQTDLNRVSAYTLLAILIIDQHSAIQTSTAQGLKTYLLSSGIMECRILSLEQASSLVNKDDTFCISLIEMERPILSLLDEVSFAALRHILTRASKMLWVTKGGGKLHGKPEFHLIDGLARVTRGEFHKLMFTTLALENCDLKTGPSLIDRITQVIQQMLRQTLDDYEAEYIESNEALDIGRVVEACGLNDHIFNKSKTYHHNMQGFGAGPPLALYVNSPGSLDSLRFLEATSGSELETGEVEIKIESTGVNFLDCLTALGQIDRKIIGGECAGIVSRVGPECPFHPGDRVVSLALGTYQTVTRAPSQCVATLPEGLSSSEASALPIIFCTAWIALCETARLQKGESILIHAGAGGTGQAAVQVAKYLGAEVYVTVGSDQKKDLLKTLYNIPDDRIFYSRDTTFAQGVMRTTGGRGVDVVLNSLSGEGLRASWECLAPLGRFIEIGKRDINARGNLPMWPFHKVVTFASVDLLTIMKERPSMIRDTLSIIISKLAEGVLCAPQPLQIFGIAEVEKVFRLMQSGQNVGKIVIEMRDKDIVPTTLPSRPEYFFDPESSYLISGGLGGLGRSAARWMASRGAKHLILLSRSGVKTQASVALVDDLKTMGVQVNTPTCDITDSNALSAILSASGTTLPPVKGVIQASMVLKDTLLEKMTIEDWNCCLEPKVQGSWNLHTLLPRNMDFFICLSSLAGIIGTIGQANYAAANTYMDALVRYRVMQGEKATSLDLGWMESEGVIAENAHLAQGIAHAGTLIPISEPEFHALLDYHCNPTRDLLSTGTYQSVLGPEVPATLQAKGLKEPQWMQSRMFNRLRQVKLSDQSPTTLESTTNYAAILSDASSLEEATAVVTEALLQKLSRALAVPAEHLDTTKPLHAYGVDSLLAVELRNFFAKELGADVAVFDITSGSSFEAVSMVVARKSSYFTGALKAGE